MYIPSIKKFDFNKETKCYERRFIIKDKVYLISVLETEWKSNMTKRIERWLETVSNIETRFPYGKLTKIDYITKDDILCNRCEYCSKELSCLKYKKRHMSKCTFKDRPREPIIQETQLIPCSETTPPPPPLINERVMINNTNNNTTNNTTNNINNGVTLNIQINSFGKENPKWLDNDTINYVFRDQVKGIVSLIQAKHFNSEFPENQNIRLDTKNNINKFVQVYQKGKWRVRQTKPIIDSMLLNAQDLVTNIVDTDNMLDETNEDEEYHAKVIKDFQETDRFKDNSRRLRTKWKDVNEIMTSGGPEYKKIVMSLKTILVDRNLNK